MAHARFAVVLSSFLTTLPLYPHSDSYAAASGYPHPVASALSAQGVILLAESKLPGGVTSRLKQINQELDRAEKALAKGAGSVQDRAQRASLYAKKANTIRSEIDKRYAGQFSPDHPQVSPVYGRITQVEQQIAEAAKSQPAAPRADGTAAAPPAAKAAPAAVRQAAAPAAADSAAVSAAPAGLPQGAEMYLRKLTPLLEGAEQALNAGNMRQAGSYLDKSGRIVDSIQKKFPQAGDFEEARTLLDRYASLQKSVNDTAASNENAVQQWTETFRPFVEGDLALLVYDTDKAELWTTWKNSYDQVKPLWDEYQSAQLAEKSGELTGMEIQLEQQLQRYQELYPEWEKKNAAAAALRGEVLFSAAPIDPANPQGTANSFKAGDHIYGHIKAKKSWKEIFGNQVNVMIDTQVDGQKVHAQFINLKSAELQNSSELPFEIAPAADKMTAYSNPDMEYGTSRAGVRQGPQELTSLLAQLPPGKHRMDFTVQYYGKVYARGGFEIEGQDFGFYADLNKKAVAAAAGAVTLPAAKMSNAGMEKKMRTLLEAAGWEDIHRLNIVDKDWWLDRVSGGDSPISSRHMDAAVLARDSGGYYYKKVRFQEDRLITGGFGELYILHTGDRYDVPEQNIDK